MNQSFRGKCLNPIKSNLFAYPQNYNIHFVYAKPPVISHEYMNHKKLFQVGFHPRHSFQYESDILYLGGLQETIKNS